jgi:hypothetical protein
MVDAWTNWMLEPVHSAIFSVLKDIPTDGTFNQVAPVERLIKRYSKEGIYKDVYSIDLSAATDRLPISLQVILIRGLFRRLKVTSYDFLADLWAKILVERGYSLTLKKFTIDFSKKIFRNVRIVLASGPVLYRTARKGTYASKKTWITTLHKYAVGQPMGALSS